MPSVETAARGAVLKISNKASTPVFTAIGGITGGPSGAGYAQQFIEALTHDSNIAKRKHSQTTLQPLTLTILYDSSDAQHQALVTAAEDGTLEDFELVLTDTGAEEWAFSAWIDFSISADPGSFNEATLSLTLDGGTGATRT